jgi:hypothetical protein
LPLAVLANPQAGATVYFDGTAATSYQFGNSAPGSYAAGIYSERNGIQCPLPGGAHLTVHPLPQPELFMPAQLCMTDINAAALLIPALDGNGEFTVNGTTQPAAFPLSAFAPGSISAIYKYTDANGCKAEAAASSTLLSTPQPAPITPVKEYISNNPSGIINAAGNAGSINWYSSSMAPLYSGNTYTHPNRTLPNNATYYVTQTISGCESQPIEVIYNIENCPVPAPALPAGYSICHGHDAMLNFSKDASASSAKWFYNSAEISSTENHTAAMLAEGSHTFTAVQYGICPSQPSSLTVNVFKMPDAMVNMPASTVICSGAAVPAFSYSGLYIPEWESAAGVLNNTGSFLTIGPADYVTGSNNYRLRVYKELPSGERCYSQPVGVSFTVKAPVKAPEIIPSLPVCAGILHQPAIVIPVTGLEPRWYYDAAGAAELPATRGQGSYAPPAVIGSDNRFYLQNWDGDCRSALIPVDFKVNQRPAIPVLTDENACSATGHHCFEPTNRIAGYNTEWLSSAGVFLSGSDIFCPPVSTTSSTIYKVRFGNQLGCYSSASDFTYNYYAPPAVSLELGRDKLCEGSLQTSSLDAIPAQGVYDAIRIETPFGDEESSSLSLQAESKFSGPYRAYSYIAYNGIECRSAASPQVTLSVLPEIASPQAYYETDICDGKAAVLFINPALAQDTIYLSSSFEAKDSVGTRQGNYWDLADTAKIGRNIFYYWARNQCPSSVDSIEFFIHEKPAMPDITSSALLTFWPGGFGQCYSASGPEPIYASSPGSSISWYGGWAPAGSGTDSALFEAPVMQPGDSALVTLEAVSGYGCTSVFPLLYSLIPSPEPLIKGYVLGGADTVCMHHGFKTYSIDAYSQDGAYSWDYSKMRKNQPQAEKESESAIRINFDFAAADTLILLQQYKGCKGRHELPVVALPRVKPSIGLSSYPGTGTAYLENTTPWPDVHKLDFPVNFTWHLGAETIQQTDSAYRNGEILKIPYSYGYHTVSLVSSTTEDGYCSGTYSLGFFMDASMALYLPAAFTGGSGAEGHSKWKPAGHNIKEYSAKVFDAWGNLVWQSSKLTHGQPAEAWDGTDAWGNTLSGGVYTYKIDATFINGQKWANPDGRIYGNILLIK